MTDLKIGSLFSGYGGLDLGVQQVLGGSVAWHVEFDEAPSAVLAHHWPDVPNYGDVAAVDWWNVEQVDVLTGGFPCQDVSLAGLRRGLQDGTRSGLWSEYARAIDVLRPALVVIENVRGLLSATADRQMESSPWGVGDRHDGPALRALGAVLGDLAELGYDAEWCGLRAADAGAPHGRYRVFIVAHPARKPGIVGDGDDVRAGSGAGRRQSTAGRSGDASDSAELGRARDRSSRAGRAGSEDDGLAPQDAVVKPRAERWVAASGQAEGGRSRTDAGGRGRALATHTDDAADHGQRACTRPTLREHVAVADTDDDGGRAGDEVGSAIGRVATAGDRSGAGAPADARSARLREHTGEPSTEEAGALGGDVAAGAGRPRPDRDWGPYRAAVDRWERVTGRVAPAPTNADGRNGTHRLAPEFVEWMMGLPAGHVTSAPITRAQQLKALGNGVVPQQAALAVSTLLARAGWEHHA